MRGERQEDVARANRILRLLVEARIVDGRCRAACDLLGLRDGRRVIEKRPARAEGDDADRAIACEEGHGHDAAGAQLSGDGSVHGVERVREEELVGRVGDDVGSPRGQSSGGGRIRSDGQAPSPELPTRAVLLQDRHARP